MILKIVILLYKNRFDQVIMNQYLYYYNNPTPSTNPYIYINELQDIKQQHILIINNILFI